MRLGELDLRELAHRLRHGRLTLRTPPFVARLQSNSPEVLAGLALCYDRFELGDDDEFADFHLRVHREGGWLHRLYRSARFWSDGRAAFSSLASNQAFHMIEWGLNWAVTAHAHRYVVYHAAVLEKQGAAVVMPAPPGSGKSTLSAALAQRGWRLLSDELALCDPQTGQMIGLARPVNLKNAAIEVIRQFAPEARLTREVPATAKGRLALMRAPDASIDAVCRPATPRWVVLPRYVEGSACFMVERDKASTFMMLAEQAFNYDIHGAQGFQTTAQLIESCQCLDFSYSSLDDAVESFDALAARGAAA